MIALDFPAAPLITLEDGHRRRPKIMEAVSRAVKAFDTSKVVRVGWWDGQNAPIVEFEAGTELESLEIDPAPFVRDKACMICCQVDKGLTALAVARPTLAN